MPDRAYLTLVADRFISWVTSADWGAVSVAFVLVAATYAIRKPLARLVIGVFDRLMSYLSVGLSEKAKSELTVTTSVLIVALAWFIALELLDLPSATNHFLHRLLTSVAIIAVFAGWYNLCGAFVSMLQGGRLQDLNIESNWIERVARFGILLFGITALLKVWEVDISGALTGVGVLGAGLAIATQDMIRNLIAGMNNISERRFAVGDAVQIEGVLVGTVEQIDLRSTLIRGYDQIPRYVPNSELSNAVVLNYAQRRNRRIKLSIPLPLTSRPEQIEEIRDKLKEYISQSGDFDLSDAAPKHVYVEGMSNCAILLMFYAWTQNADYETFLQVNERLTLRILSVIEDTGTVLAYPTQTVEIHSQN